MAHKSRICFPVPTHEAGKGRVFDPERAWSYYSLVPDPWTQAGGFMMNSGSNDPSPRNTIANKAGHREVKMNVGDIFRL